jgi:hypothetical protein
VQVYDPVAYVERGEVKVLGKLAPGTEPLSIPMAIIYGDADERKRECQGVQAICDPGLLSVFVHEGGHEIPGLGAKNGLSGAVKMAHRGITRAQLAGKDYKPVLSVYVRTL